MKTRKNTFFRLYKQHLNICFSSEHLISVKRILAQHIILYKKWVAIRLPISYKTFKITTIEIIIL